MSAAADPPPRDASDSIVRLTARPYIALGMPRADVKFMLGEPSQKLSADLWVYTEFKAAAVPNPQNLDTLLVVFTGDRVSLIRLVSSAALRALNARQRAKVA